MHTFRWALDDVVSLLPPISSTQGGQRKLRERKRAAAGSISVLIKRKCYSRSCWINPHFRSSTAPSSLTLNTTPFREKRPHQRQSLSFKCSFSVGKREGFGRISKRHSLQMEENPSGRISRKNPRSKKSSRNTRFAAEQDPGDSFDCTGKQCRSCAAALIADCVAVCCCPLALVSLLALAFVKVPYLMGRRCLRRRKRKRSKKVGEASSGSLDPDLLVTSGSFISGKSDIVLEFGDDDDDEEELEERKSFCAAFEADKVLFELYQVGHLGFGRVSFTGIQSFGKGN